MLYDYHNSRVGQCAVDFINGYSGYLKVDGYQAYAHTDATLAACLAHVRRKFIEAKGTNKKAGKADVALKLIGKLYGIEQQIKDKTAAEKYAIRKQKFKSSLMNFINGYYNIKIKSHRKWHWESYPLWAEPI
nr:transposase [Shewanella sp. UCD-KL21]